MIITAHSGCEGTPTDSIESVYRAIELGARAIEIDVRIDQAGTLRISHNHRESLEEFEKAAAVEQAFRLAVQHGLTVNCDMKEAGLIHEVIALGKKCGLDRDHLWVTGSISTEQLVREPGLKDHATFIINIEEILKVIYLHEASKDDYSDFTMLMNNPWTYVETWVDNLTKERLQQVIALWKVTGADGLNIPKRNLPEFLFRDLAEAQVPLSIWTVNEEDIARHILSQKQSSVINMTTRQVQLLQRVVKEFQ